MLGGWGGTKAWSSNVAMEYPPCRGLQTHGPCHTCRIYRATSTTPCLSHFLRLYLLPFDSESCENSGLPAAQKRSDIRLKKHKRQGRTETWTSALWIGIFFFVFFFLHEGLSGRRRFAATLAFQQIPILRQQEKNERGLPAAFHQKPKQTWGTESGWGVVEGERAFLTPAAGGQQTIPWSFSPGWCHSWS